MPLAHLVLGLHPSLQLLYGLTGCFFLCCLDGLCSRLGLQLCHLHTCSSVSYCPLGHGRPGDPYEALSFKSFYSKKWDLWGLTRGRRDVGLQGSSPAAASVQPLHAGPLTAASTEWQPHWPLEGPPPASGCCPEVRRTRPPTGPPLQSCGEDTGLGAVHGQDRRCLVGP